MKPLYLPTEELVVHQINDDNPNAKISLDKVTLSKPKVIDKTGADGKKRNSEYVVTARKGKGFRDTVPVTANRLDMGAMFRNTNVFLDVHNPKSSTDLLAALNRGYGLALVESDIVPADIADGVNPPVTDPEAPEFVPVDHTITMHADCPSFIGTLAVKIGPKPATGERLNLVITKTELDGLAYPDGSSETKGQGYVYSYGVDCSPLLPYFESLAGTAAGTALDEARLAKELNKVFFEEWKVNATDADFNTKGAKLSYIGPTSTTSPQGTVYRPGVNQAFTEVMIVELGSLCNNLQGLLWLHYNA